MSKYNFFTENIFTESVFIHAFFKTNPIFIKWSYTGIYNTYTTTKKNTFENNQTNLLMHSNSAFVVKTVYYFYFLSIC